MISFDQTPRFLFFAALVLFVISCNTQKHLSVPKDYITAFTKEEIYDNIFHPDTVNWFSAKAKIKIKNNHSSQKALMYLRMKSDSAIWLVFKKLSVEAARALVTKDSLNIIYRLDKTYQSEHLDSIQNVYGFNSDYSFMQDFILARVPAVDTTKLWKEKEHSETYEFRSMFDDKVIDFTYQKQDGLLSSGKFYDRFNLDGNWEYSDYRIVQGHKIPFQRKFQVNFDADNYLDLEINFIEIDVEKAHNLKFEIPDHYSRIRY